MSIKIMAQVWDLDLSPTEKLILLAYTDHADHDGGNIYPAVKTIATKTGLSERSVQLMTRSLEKKGYLETDGKGPKGTNKWQFRGATDSPRTRFRGEKDAGGGESDGTKGVNPDSPEPSFNRPIESSRGRNKPAQKSPPANRVPELIEFRRVTGGYPSKGSFETVIKAMRKSAEICPDPEVRKFHLQDCYREWTDRGYNPRSVKWLSEWAISGIPAIGANGSKGKKQSAEQVRSELQEWVSEVQGEGVADGI